MKKTNTIHNQDSVWDMLKKQAYINSEHHTAVVLQTGRLQVAVFK